MRRSASVHASAGADGTPVGGAVVQWTNATEGERTRTTRADDQGGYELPALPPGDYRVMAHHPDLGACHEERTLDADAMRHDLTLDEGSSVDLRVVSLDGHAQGDASIHLYAVDGPGDTTPFQGITDGAGRFRAEHLPPGDYFLVVQADGYARALRRVHARSGQLLKETVEMSRGALLEGTVMSAAGVPVAGCLLTLPEEVGVPAERTDPEGRFSFRGLAGGVYELTVLRSPTGFCRDADNGHYELTVMVNGAHVLLTPVCDDC